MGESFALTALQVVDYYESQPKTIRVSGRARNPDEGSKGFNLRV